MSAKSALALSLTLALSGCAAGLDDPTAEDSQLALAMSAADAARILDLVNYPGTDLALLDGAIGLDRRAAAGIVAQRNGADGVAPSGDDDLFADVAALDAVPYVGDTAFQKLRDHAAAHPAPAAETVEAVLFRGWEAESVVWGVNHATADELDVAAGLDSRAARNLVAGAPFASVTAMGPLGYVGQSALQSLRAHAPTWWARMRGGGASPATVTYDGVAFDEVTARTALEIANLATSAQLVGHGMWSTGAARLIAARPYATLAAVSAVDGVGTATMRSLHDYAASGSWTPPAPPPPDPGPCAVGLATRADATAEDLTELLALATTADWPAVEVVALQASACLDMTDAADRDALRAALIAAPEINWGYEPGLISPTADPPAPGAAYWITLADGIAPVIQEHIDGGWTPSSPRAQDLLDRLPALQAALSAGAHADPGHYWETALEIEASECSQLAVVLIDPADLRIWVVHRFPRC